MTDLIDALMLEVLTKMSVISEQRGRTYEAVNVHGGERSQIPRLSEKPLIDYYRERFNNAKSSGSRRTILLEAVEALKIARKTPLPDSQEPLYGTTQWKLWVARSPLDSKEIARRFSCTSRYVNMVRRAMREGGLMPLNEDQRAA